MAQRSAVETFFSVVWGSLCYRACEVHIHEVDIDSRLDSYQLL
jgi:hypothetical protein